MTIEHFREWSKKNPPKPQPSSSFKRTILFVIAAGVVARTFSLGVSLFSDLTVFFVVLAYYSRARWVGVFDVLSE